MEIVSNKEPAMSEPIRVYVSYSWRVEVDTGIVKQLGELCKPRGIELIYDKTELKHRDRISGFMDRLASADHVITVFSKNYFESEYCMYELMKIRERGDFDQRIHPVVADGLKLHDSETRRQCITFWKKRIAGEEEAINDQLDAGDAPDQHEKLNFYIQIKLKVSGFMKEAGDMVITPLHELQEHNYAPLLDNIAPLKTDTPPLPNTPDSEFCRQIKAKIAEELSRAEVAVFTDVLRVELNRVLDGLGQSERKISGNKPQIIAETLVWVLANGKKEVPVINKALKNAFMHCFDKRRGKKYEAARKVHGEIIEAVEQVLGWLVLASIDEKQLSPLVPEAGYGRGVHFELPVRTQLGVEVIVSRRHQRRADLQSSGSEVSGSHILCAHADQFSWNDAATVDDLQRMLWNRVFPEESQNTSLTSDQVERLNAELQTRRLDEWDTEHHYIAIQYDNFDGDDSYKSVYKQLLSALDQLTLVRFGVAGNQSIFCTLEYNLMSAINRFLSTINKMI